MVVVRIGCGGGLMSQPLCHICTINGWLYVCIGGERNKGAFCVDDEFKIEMC